MTNDKNYVLGRTHEECTFHAICDVYIMIAFAQRKEGGLPEVR
jgi:hypothetical protein